MVHALQMLSCFVTRVNKHRKVPFRSFWKLQHQLFDTFHAVHVLGDVLYDCSDCFIAERVPQKWQLTHVQGICLIIFPDVFTFFPDVLSHGKFTNQLSACWEFHGPLSWVRQRSQWRAGALEDRRSFRKANDRLDLLPPFVWRLIGISYYKINDLGGDCCWDGGSSQNYGNLCSVKFSKI